VKNLSSVSCVCLALSSLNLSVDDQIIARKKNTGAKFVPKVIENVIKETSVKKDSVAYAKTQSYPKTPGQKSTEACRFIPILIFQIPLLLIPLVPVHPVTWCTKHWLILNFH